MSKIRVITKRVGENPKIEMIENDCDSLQSIVDGLFDITTIPNNEDIDVYCNDEGLIMNLTPNILRPEYNDFLVGNLIFTSYDSDGNTVGLNDEQIERVMKYLNRYSIPVEILHIMSLYV